MKNNWNKKLAGITAVVAVIAILLTGSYAWRDFSQVKINEASGNGEINEVRLVEDYDEIEDWSMENAKKTKRIYVKNTGTEKTQETFVRLKIGEYMDLIDIQESPERLLLDENGDFVSFDTEASAQAAYPNHEVKSYQEYRKSEPKYYIVTQEKDENGQFGKKMLLYSDERELVAGNGTERPTVNGQEHSQVECDKFELYSWDGSGKIREYIEFQDGTNALGEYDSASDGQWIIDTKDGVNTGWVYWSKPLAPGEETTDFISSMELIKQPTGKFFYSSDVHMETLTWDELNEDTWTDLSQDMKHILSVGNDSDLGDNSTADNDTTDNSTADNGIEGITVNTPIGTEFQADGVDWLVIGKGDDNQSLLIMTKFTQGEIQYNDESIYTYKNSNLERKMEEFIQNLVDLKHIIQKVELKDSDLSKVNNKEGDEVAFALSKNDFEKYLKNNHDLKKVHPLNPERSEGYDFVYGYNKEEIQEKSYWLRGSNSVDSTGQEGLDTKPYNSQGVEYRPALWIKP